MTKELFSLGTSHDLRKLGGCFSKTVILSFIKKKVE